MVTIMKRLNIYVYMATELSNTVVMLHSQNVGRMGQTEKKTFGVFIHYSKVVSPNANLVLRPDP